MRSKIDPEQLSDAKAIEVYYHLASGCASREIERLARKILLEHPNLDEFVMGMGTWFFSDKHRERYGDNECSVHLEYMKPVGDFLREWDKWLHITGEPMRFTAKGKKVTNW